MQGPGSVAPGSSPAFAGDYVELGARSAFSFLDGASNPEELASRAAELGHETLALADRGGLYGAPRFHAACREAGLRALHGARLEVEGLALTLLVESQAGWRNLCRLLTLAQEHTPKGEARASWDQVEAHAAGLLALLPASGRLTRAFVDRALGVFGPARCALSVARVLDRRLAAESRFAVALAEAARLPVAACGDVRAARPEGRRLLDAFACLREGTCLDAAGRRLLPNGERVLRAPAESAARFADRPDFLRTTRALAERCAFTLDDLGYRFPEFPVPGGETPDSWLRRLAFEGARERYGRPLPPRVRAQLDHELAVIGRLGLAGYFLIVHDIARFARTQGILSQGRGSAANSAVCYALGITAVDPVGMELLFERFLSEERGEWPDIDIDLPSGEPRERVIQYVCERYGPRGVGMTATVITYRARSAVREMGKVLGMDADAVDRLAKILATADHQEGLDELPALLAGAGVDPRAPRVARLLALVEQVRGLPRHLGQHTGGLVIAAGRLDEVVPIEPASMPGRRVVQWDKDDCADLGLIKIDLLGLGMLRALEETKAQIRRHEGTEIDLAKLPPDDPVTYAMIRRADTVGVFQIESRAQMATLPRMKPRHFYDLVVEVALIRPGPVVGQMVHPYLARRAGREPVTYPHPALEPILKRTLGVPLFQEQLLRMAMTVSGFSGGEAEELRRALGFKRSAERMRRIEAKLRRGMEARGIVGEAQEEIVRGITSFALYGFPESHAASFALIAYASAYLRAHHPAAFLAGMLDAWPLGFYSPATLVKDAQRHGVTVRPACAAHSDWNCTLEPLAAPSAPAREPAPRAPTPEAPPTRTDAARHAVRLGLRLVRGLSAATGEHLVAARAEAPFRSAADLARRAEPRRDELLALAECGALAGVEPRAATRRAALWQVAALERDRRALFAGAEPPGDAGSPLPELDPLEATLADYRTTGLTTGPHVMAHLRPELRRRGVLSTQEVAQAPNGRRVRTAGHVIVRQRPGSARGFCFLTLEDETGTTNGVLTPDAFRRLRGPLHASPLLLIEGPVQSLEGVVHVRIRRIEPLRTADLPEAHDYR